MAAIHVLDDNTINQIAAGEVIERPSAVVKELVENSIDANSTQITVEIKDGGLSLIRVTDNGAGMNKEDVPLAFLRHATSKISSIEDLFTIASLGFRGEALSSIASVAQVELITKPQTSLSGFRYCIEGGVEKAFEEVGSPNGTTFLVRNIFYNTPARRKFLKSPTTEAGYIEDFMERVAISHPEIAFKFIHNNKTRIQTSGSSQRKDILYQIYGREIVKELVSVSFECEEVKITGYVGKPVITRGNRNYENYFINGRYIKSSIINKAIEEAYKPYMMQHKYPFTALDFQILPELIDVNVHPQKLELRIRNQVDIFEMTKKTIQNALEGTNLIPSVSIQETEKSEHKELDVKSIEVSRPAEPFEVKRQQIKPFNSVSHTINPDNKGSTNNTNRVIGEQLSIPLTRTKEEDMPLLRSMLRENSNYVGTRPVNDTNETSDANKTSFLSEEGIRKSIIIGQLFATYWLVEYNEQLYIIDQHAAHEKVLYERNLKAVKAKQSFSQQLLIPIVLTLNLREQEVLLRYKEELIEFGFEIEHFGGNEFSVRGVPCNLSDLSKKELLLEFLDGLVEDNYKETSDIILEKIASMSCKAAVKANHILSDLEARSLIKELLSLDNPFHCPHGRPVIISMTKYDIEKKFKRII